MPAARSIGEAAGWPAREGGGRIPYVFVLAASHSGSTLLTLLLNSHPEVATVGELTSGAVRNVPSYRCSCRTPIEECAFWRRVAEAVRTEHPAFDLASFGILFERPPSRWARRLARIEHRGRLLETVRSGLLGLSPAWRRHQRGLERGSAAVARAVLRLEGARVFADSSKLAHRLLFLGRMAAFDLRVIHVVRDGRAVALTYTDHERLADAAEPDLRRGGLGEASPWRPESVPFARAAEEWRRAQTSAEHALRGLDPRRWIRVRYEDLCTRPTETLAGLFTFLGLDPGRAAADFRSVPHHVVGNGMRLDRTSTVRLDERWRGVLTARDLAAFEAVAGEANRRYGYS